MDFNNGPSASTTTVTDDGTCDKVRIYSETNYSGFYYELDGGEEVECFDWSPLSICVPDHKKITFWEDCDFANASMEFSASTADLQTELNNANFGTTFLAGN